MEMTKLEKDFLEKLRTKNIDLNGRRVINAGEAIDDNDYVTFGQLKKLLGIDEEE